MSDVLRILRTPGKSVFAGNDYLCLAKDPRVVEALCHATELHGVSTMSSRWALGWTDPHAELERALADFFGAEDAVIFATAYLAGLAYAEVIADMTDRALIYRNSHSNLYAGLKVEAIPFTTFVDTSDLHQHDAEGRYAILTDGVHSISGEVAPAQELLAFAGEREAELLVDDAHGVFVMGEHGRGGLDASPLPANVSVVGSLGKALGCSGGFVVGRADLISRMRRSAPATGATPPPAPIAAAALAALKIVQEEPERRQRTQRRAKEMRQILSAYRVCVVSNASPIVAMIFADEEEAEAASQQFLDRDILIPYFTYPSEPRQNLLRAIARSDYSDEEMQRFAEAVEEVVSRRSN